MIVDTVGVTVVEWLIKVMRAYVFAGILFSAVFVVFGIHRVDPDAQVWRIGFRLIIFPGLCIFWPLFATRWIRGKHKPVERNAHRIAPTHHRNV